MAAAEPLPTQRRFVVLGALDDSIDEGRGRASTGCSPDVTCAERGSPDGRVGHMALRPRCVEELVDFFRASRDGVERAGVESGRRSPPTRPPRARGFLSSSRRGFPRGGRERLTIGVAMRGTHLYRPRRKLSRGNGQSWFFATGQDS